MINLLINISELLYNKKQININKIKMNMSSSSSPQEANLFTSKPDNVNIMFNVLKQLQSKSSLKQNQIQSKHYSNVN